MQFTNATADLVISGGGLQVIVIATLLIMVAVILVL